MRGRGLPVTAIGAIALMMAAGCQQAPKAPPANPVDGKIAAEDWPSYNRTGGEQHFSPLTSINTKTVNQLGLAWSYDLPAEQSMSQPIEAKGVVYTATGHSYIRAFDATTGKLLWEFDSHANEQSGVKLRRGYGSRGLAYEDGRVFTATHDGRLIALDAHTGTPLWSVLTTEPGDYRYITGAPRAFDGRVIIGHAGADGGGARGYVTCYDTATGKQLWRFYTVPGDPAKGFEDDAMKMAAKTWTGQWWVHGGGGTVWNSISYDPELKQFYIGVGNGYPYNQKLRSPGGGDNLFLASIVALDAVSGKYVWHYQVNPGEQWDYVASMDMALATLQIDGQPRKVLMEVPKNGFHYVIDRTNGKLISAKPVAKVTWASEIDLKTGRPVENPAARYHGRGMFEMWPGFEGAHSVQPSSYSPQTGLNYIPVIEQGMLVGDQGVDLRHVQYGGKPANLPKGMGITANPNIDLPGSRRSFLRAWDPVTQKLRWEVEQPGNSPGGTMATAGNLVFEGQINHNLVAYDATTGKKVWSYDAKAPIVAAPISYAVNGRQYITVLTGSGTGGGGAWAKGLQGFGIDFHTEPRRVLTFALGSQGVLPPAPPPIKLVAPDDPSFKSDVKLEARGNGVFHSACAVCHGLQGMAGGTAPDLRVSPIPLSKETFVSVVHDGALVPQGMPQFADLPLDDLEAIRQYVRSLGQALPGGKGGRRGVAAASMVLK